MKRFLELLNETIYKNIEEVNIDVERLASILHISRITLYRKIKAITNLSPVEFIAITRLKKQLIIG